MGCKVTYRDIIANNMVVGTDVVTAVAVRYVQNPLHKQTEPLSHKMTSKS